ncbi:DUF551 domain-containing protein [Salmonella enterica subsp. enterica serovar Anatum]|uniref:DUF551 domain-containing protein n=1 Tax=Salmonella enterica TaxID=28901 RepID=UPI004054330C
MTTITNKKQYPSEQYLNELITNMEFAAMAPVEVVRVMAAELQERRKADNKEPAGYHVIRECGKVGCSVATLEEAEKTRDFWNKKWTIRPYFYTAQPAQETGVYKDMLNIIGLLENNEWAEHCTSTVLGSLLESEITRLVGKEQPAPVVPDEMPKGLAGQIVSLLAHNIGDKFLAKKIWNACRAAMLQANQRDLSQPVDPQVAEYEQIMLQAGNSPVTPDGWISCSERMPDDKQYVWFFGESRGFAGRDTFEGYYDWSRNKWWAVTDIGEEPASKVTHWMPLPEPPQQ